MNIHNAPLQAQKQICQLLDNSLKTKSAPTVLHGRDTGSLTRNPYIVTADENYELQSLINSISQENQEIFYQTDSVSTQIPTDQKQDESNNTDQTQKIVQEFDFLEVMDLLSLGEELNTPDIGE